MGMEQTRPEVDIQHDILELLEMHPAIAWAKRMNVGRAKMGQRWVMFGFPGCSDIIGQMADGRFFACEVKKPGEKPTEAQQRFLDQVAVKGVAMVATNVSDVLTLLNAHTRAEGLMVAQELEFAG